MASPGHATSGKRPRPLGNEAVRRYCAMAVAIPPGARLDVSRHARKDHPERGIGAEHIILGLRNPRLGVDRKGTRFLDPPGVWSYRLETRLGKHPFRIVIAFDPPEPIAGASFSVKIVTAYFPGQPDGELPGEFRAGNKERAS